ncbi:MAG: peptidoglycan editing factor PgeF [Christensenellales bacterium]|jgi:YfiH family protein
MIQYIDAPAGASLMHFELLDRVGFVSHGFTTRLGGVSPGAMASLNMGFGRNGDPDRHVRENYRRAVTGIGGRLEHLVKAHQVHGDRVVRVTRADIPGAGWYRQVKGYLDGMVTDAPGVVLSTRYADCVPVFLADPVRRAIGLVHAGWRGTTLHIAQKGVAALTEHFGSDPKDVVAVVGPSIGPCCFHVHAPVKAVFDRCCPDAPQRPLADGRVAIDLWQANRLQLLSAGLLPEHIQVAGLCTSCQQALFFSHRRDRGKSGLMSAMMMIQP